MGNVFRYKIEPTTTSEKNFVVKVYLNKDKSESKHGQVLGYCSTLDDAIRMIDNEHEGGHKPVHIEPSESAFVKDKKELINALSSQNYNSHFKFVIENSSNHKKYRWISVGKTVAV